MSVTSNKTKPLKAQVCKWRSRRGAVKRGCRIPIATQISDFTILDGCSAARSHCQCLCQPSQLRPSSSRATVWIHNGKEPGPSSKSPLLRKSPAAFDRSFPVCPQNSVVWRLHAAPTRLGLRRLSVHSAAYQCRPIRWLFNSSPPQLSNERSGNSACAHPGLCSKYLQKSFNIASKHSSLYFRIGTCIYVVPTRSSQPTISEVMLQGRTRRAVYPVRRSNA